MTTNVVHAADQVQNIVTDEELCTQEQNAIVIENILEGLNRNVQMERDR